jgi:hypothetical protein
MRVYPWTKEELETFLSEECGAPVICDEPFPVLAKTVSLAKYALIANAQVYKCEDGKLRAALVPFGAGLPVTAGEVS